MPSLQASGTQTAVVGTEHQLGSTILTLGIYRLWADLTALANGEICTLRCYYKVLSGGTEQLALPPAAYVNVQTDPIKFWIPLESDISIRFTLTQTGGSGRAYPWKIMAL